MARFFVPQNRIQDKRGSIDGQELEHLRRVLRLVAGDAVTVFDDTGWEYQAVIRHLSAEKAEIEILRSYPTERESSLKLTLAIGLTKGEKMDFIVEKATELGVQTIAPFISAYTVPRLDDKKLAKRSERWRKIILSATKQCGRAVIPEIVTLCDFRELVKQPWRETHKLIFWEKEAQQTLDQVHATEPHARSVLLVIGPEGGFNPSEADLAQEHGFTAVRLGRRILRTETAALAAISLVQYLWGDLK